MSSPLFLLRDLGETTVTLHPLRFCDKLDELYSQEEEDALIVTFDLSPEQANRIENARLRGVSVEQLFNEFLARLPDASLSPPRELSERNLALIALLQDWNREDHALSQEEDATRRLDGEQFTTNSQAHRVTFPTPDLPE